MSWWLPFWTFFLIVSLLIFAGLAVAVTVGGFVELRTLFKRQKAESRRQKAVGRSSEVQD